MAIDVTAMKCDINSEPAERLQFKQHDNLSRVILLELTDDGAPLDISGCTAILYARKPDSTQVFQSCEILDAEYGQLQIALKQQVLSCAGQVQCEIAVTGSDRVLTTRTFNIEVLPCVRNENAIESTDDFTDLQRLLSGYITANEAADIFSDSFSSYVQSGGTLSFSQWVACFKGDKGEKGDTGTGCFVHIRFADSDSPINSGSIYASSDGHDYIGIYSGSSPTAPPYPGAYSWIYFRGSKGDTGDTGSKGEKGDMGTTPHIGSNYNWYIGQEDTGVDARGIKGDPGIILREYYDYSAYQSALSQGLVAENELSYWGQS